MKCKTTVKLVQYIKICKKMSRESLLFLQAKTYYFSLFVDPNLPNFWFLMVGSPAVD